MQFEQLQLAVQMKPTVGLLKGVGSYYDELFHLKE